MAQKSIDMHLAKQIQQLKNEQVPIKEIVRRTGISRKTVKKYLRLMQQLPQQPDSEKNIVVTDIELADIIYKKDNTPPPGKRKLDILEHFEYAKKELHHAGVNKQNLWLEYMQQYPDGYKYSQYCYLFKKHLKDTDPAFHWEYTPGEFIQVDFAGEKISYVNKQTGELVWCQVFVAVLPYSGLIFCKAVPSQKTADFANCINELLKYTGGVSKTILCDNLKTAVTKADRYEPQFTELCYQLGEHYTSTFSATRPAKPTDKGMVEKAVNIVYSKIYALLRKEHPGSLEELNIFMRKLLNQLNQNPYKESPDGRRGIFEREELPTLASLPDTPYQIIKSKQVTVQRNYFIQLPDNRHYYSVPYEYVGHKVWVNFNQRTVEVYHKYKRIAFHVRSSTEPRYNCIKEHMPANHQYMKESAGWDTEYLLRLAGWVGPYTRQVADRIIHSSFYPQQNFKACNAMIMLQKKYSKERLEMACKQAGHIARPTLRFITTILSKGMEQQTCLFDEMGKIPSHENIRGASQYK